MRPTKEELLRAVDSLSRAIAAIAERELYPQQLSDRTRVWKLYLKLLQRHPQWKRERYYRVSSKYQFEISEYSQTLDGTGTWSEMLEGASKIAEEASSWAPETTQIVIRVESEGNLYLIELGKMTCCILL